MTDQTKQPSYALVTLESKAERLDKAAETFGVALAVNNSPFKSALLLSQGITALRDLLDDGIMREIMKLADTPLGFLTDRGPGSKTGLPYKLEEVKDAIIEASLRGFRVAGNEFNIISGRFYAAKNGLHRRVVSYEGVTDFKEFFGIPKLAGERGAIVSARATWIKDGVKCELAREFAIRVNSMMGTDAIIGKCQRKLYAAVLNQLSGIVTPEGDIDEQTTKELAVQRAKVPGRESHGADQSGKDDLSFLAPDDGKTKESERIREEWMDLLAKFGRHDVTPAELLKSVGTDNPENLTLDDTADLYKLWTAIESGQVKAEDKFPQKK